jgi:hypothetical protein
MRRDSAQNHARLTIHYACADLDAGNLLLLEADASSTYFNGFLPAKVVYVGLDAAVTG